MATYEYRCAACDGIRELECAMGEAPHVLTGRCQLCGDVAPATRVYGQVAAIVRGAHYKAPSNTVTLSEAKRLGYRGADPRDFRP